MCVQQTEKKQTELTLPTLDTSTPYTQRSLQCKEHFKGQNIY